MADASSVLCPCYRGAFSIVRKCFHKESRQEYAAKIINKRKLSARGKETKMVQVTSIVVL